MQKKVKIFKIRQLNLIVEASNRVTIKICLIHRMKQW
jgi:hypothetical protein